MRRIAIDLAIMLLALSLMAFSLGFTWAVVDDYSTRDVAPIGSVVAGVDISGMSRADARSAITSAVVEPLQAPMEVSYGPDVFTYVPALSVTVNVESMLERAFAPRDESKLVERVYSRVAQTATGSTVDTQMRVDRTHMLNWIERLASNIETAAMDATVTVEGGIAVVREAQTGIDVDTAATADAMTAAILAGVDSVQLEVRTTEPAVTGDSLGKSIVVDLSERKLYLYDGTDLEKTYGVAVGAPGHSTPTGSWVITLKRYLPSWGNPGSAWAENMPAYIPPGPSNPLGTRAINLNASGIRIHGTTQDWSIGHAASHGCMRMHRWDVEDLYDRVEVGMPVFIVR